MSAKTDIAVLEEQVRKSVQLLAKLDRFYRTFIETDLPRWGRTQAAAIVLADVFGRFYTCGETLFLRVSQLFENQLSRERWHADLLEKMTLRVPGVREAAIGDDTYALLAEFLKFRHFNRYYFEGDYDWEKIEYLQRKYEQVKPLLARDLARFQQFLEQLRESAADD